jgi:hypothetical protein
LTLCLYRIDANPLKTRFGMLLHKARGRNTVGVTHAIDSFTCFDNPNTLELVSDKKQHFTIHQLYPLAVFSNIAKL